MIFTPEHAQMILDDTKRQTRRPVKPNEMLVYATSAKPGAMFAFIQDEQFSIPTVIIYRPADPAWEDDFIRVKWQVGRDYAIQPGRGQKAVGRTPPIKAIRRERLQEISLKDLQAELGGPGVGYVLVFFFIELWDKFYRKPYDWASNPWVWALEW